MIEINDKKNCCGCNACGDACPVGAISFPSDNEGFWYPVVNREKCIECNLCQKVCPLLNLDSVKQYNQRNLQVFGGFNNNLAVRFESTSGGVFSALANAMYRQGGYVAGAIQKADFTVTNFISNNKHDLSRLRSSKYVQSSAIGLYKKIKELLEAGEQVLACGSPCQMAALRSYLGKEYNELIIVILK